MRDELFGGTVTVAKFEALSKERRAVLTKLIAYALAQGFVRFPIPEEQGLTV